MLDKLSSLQHTNKENIALKNMLHPKGSILSDNNSLVIITLDSQYSPGYKTYSIISCCHKETKRLFSSLTMSLFSFRLIPTSLLKKKNKLIK